MLPLAGWQSGYAEDCKSLYVGSIPVPASIKITKQSSPLSISQLQCTVKLTILGL